MNPDAGLAELPRAANHVNSALACAPGIPPNLRPSAFFIRGRAGIETAMLLTLLGTLALSSCGFPNRSQEAKSIALTIRAMPGVQDTTYNYDTSFDGGAHFNLDVMVGKDIPPEQAASIGGVFVDKVADAAFNSFDVSLNVTYGLAPSASSNEYGTSAKFSYAFGDPAPQSLSPSSTDVADTLRQLTKIAQHPAARAITVQQPGNSRLLPAETSTSRGFRVVLADQATKVQLENLAASFPELAEAQWVAPGKPAPGHRPNTYEITGRPPTVELRDLWQRIDQIAATAGAWISTETVIPSRTPSAATTVDLSLGASADIDDRLKKTTDSLVPALAELPGPVQLRMTWVNDSAKVTIGGCTQPKPNSPPLAPIEAQLRGVYERY